MLAFHALKHYNVHMQTQKHINKATTLVVALVLAFVCIFCTTTAYAMQINYTDSGVVYTHANGNTLAVEGEQECGEVHKNNEFYAHYSIDPNDNALVFADDEGLVLHVLADWEDEDAYAALAESILQ